MTHRIKSMPIKKNTAVILLLAFGTVLLIISAFFESKGEVKSSFDNSYGEYLERRLESTLSGLCGKGNIDVMITFENQYEALPASSTGGLFSASSPTEQVLEKPLPKISGVMIVCSGISSQQDFQTIKNAVSTALGISKNKINIIGGKIS